MQESSDEADSSELLALAKLEEENRAIQTAKQKLQQKTEKKRRKNERKRSNMAKMARLAA